MSRPTGLGERLQICLDEAGKRPADLARACKVQPSSASEWLTGASKTMRGLNLLRAAEFLGVNALWLATGEGARRPTRQAHSTTAGPMVARSTDAASDWPFRYITPMRWASLPLLDRQRIETFADATLQAWESRQTSQSNGTTG